MPRDSGSDFSLMKTPEKTKAKGAVSRKHTLFFERQPGKPDCMHSNQCRPDILKNPPPCNIINENNRTPADTEQRDKNCQNFQYRNPLQSNWGRRSI